MPQVLLNFLDRRSGLQGMGGMGVAQPVGAGRLTVFGFEATC